MSSDSTTAAKTISGPRSTSSSAARTRSRTGLSDLDPRARPLHRSDLKPDPLVQFELWLAQTQTGGEGAPQAVALATATPDGRPSVRMVLLRDASRRGFSFFSSYESRKGREL